MIDRFLDDLFPHVKEGEPLRTVRARNPSPMTLDGTRTYVVGRERPAVIDPGPDDPAHLDAVVAALQGATPVAILLTHSHADHAAGAPALAERTGAPVMMAQGALAPPFPPERVGRWLADGDTVDTDSGTLRALATPGHAPEHLCFVWTGGEAPQGGAVFVGDHLMGHGDTTLVAPPEGELGAYLDSLNRIDGLEAEILYPTHGEEIRDPSLTIERYRRHREERIEQVVRALRRAGPSTPPQIVGEIYGEELDPALRQAAEASLGALLAFLVSTGDVRAEEGGAYGMV